MIHAPQPHTNRNSVPGFGNVAWTRGRSCLPVAEHLTDGPIFGLTSDLHRSCVADRIDILIAKRFTGFDLVPTVVPHDVDLDVITQITVAAGEGPHSPLAIAIADRLAWTLGVPVEAATVFRNHEELPPSLERLNRLTRDHPDVEVRAINGASAVDLVDSLDPTTLLVVGAPGGSWFQRQIFGPGHRLVVSAPSGALVVRDAPRRCYHNTVSPTGVVISPHLTAADASQLVAHKAVPVADDGQLVGILRADALRNAPPNTRVSSIMEGPVAVVTSEPATAAHELSEFLTFAPVPVIDNEGQLVGVIPPDRT